MKNVPHSRFFFFLFLTFLGLEFSAKAVTSAFPKLPSKVGMMEEVMPTGWKEIGSAMGDLNRDGLIDFVLVFESEEETVTFEDDYQVPIRMMGIYLATKKGWYKRAQQCNEFILHSQNENMDDPFVGIKIENGNLCVDLYLWYSSGSWLTSSHTYMFKYQNNTFELVNYKGFHSHRSTGETWDYHIFFEERKMSVLKGNHFSDEKSQKTKWKHFKLKKLKNLNSLPKPFEWDFHGLML